MPSNFGGSNARTGGQLVHAGLHDAGSCVECGPQRQHICAVHTPHLHAHFFGRLFFSTTHTAPPDSEPCVVLAQCHMLPKSFTIVCRAVYLWLACAAPAHHRGDTTHVGVHDGQVQMRHA